MLRRVGILRKGGIVQRQGLLPCRRGASQRATTTNVLATTFANSHKSSSSSTRSAYWLALVLTSTVLYDNDRHRAECQLSASLVPVAKADGILVKPREDMDDMLREENTSTLRRVYKRAVKVVRYMQRLFMYALLGLPAAAIVPAAYAASAIIPSAEEWGWNYMIWAIEQLGPTFIKLAQWASTRPDLYPPSLVEKLQKLQDNVSVSYPMSVVEQTLAEAFGADWRTRLQLDPHPLGAGCVAQVFRGVLSSSSGSSSR